VRDLGQRYPEARLREVPVLRARELDSVADPSGRTRIWLAIEALQVTGSFKVRGALAALAADPADDRPLVAASAGNHGVGLAYAAQVFGRRATVVVPRSAPQNKQQKIRDFGAEVVVSSARGYDEAEVHAKALAAETGARFVSPYDDDVVVAGNGASLGYEIVRALGGVPERVIAPFGGGGLATGLSWALADEAAEPLGASRCVWGVQSSASPAMALSIERGQALERFDPLEQTLAEGLEGGIAQTAYHRAIAAIAGVIVAPEYDIPEAITFAFERLGLTLEGSAAVALVPVLFGLPSALVGGDVVVVLTGRNIDEDRLASVVFARESTTQVVQVVSSRGS
jgi:threonine dehydratase